MPTKEHDSRLTMPKAEPLSPPKFTDWMPAAFDRIAAGENEREVMLDYGYLHKSALGRSEPKK